MKLFDLKDNEQKIMECIQKDCRITFSQISKKRGIPLTTICKNYEKLMKEYDLGFQLEPTGKTISVKGKIERNAQRIIKLMDKDPRMPLTEMKKRLKMPVSTLHDTMNKIKKKYYIRGIFKSKESGTK